jgi:hypothetical protein
LGISYSITLAYHKPEFKLKYREPRRTCPLPIVLDTNENIFKKTSYLLHLPIASKNCSGYALQVKNNITPNIT